MKSKLVKYPFNEKRYRWDTHTMGKTFEYSWNRQIPGATSYQDIFPYIKFETVPKSQILANPDDYGYIDLTYVNFAPQVRAMTGVTPNVTYMIRLSDWPDIDSYYVLNVDEVNITVDDVMLFQPVVKLIGDYSSDIAYVPEDNQEILSYIIGDPSGSDFNPKSLQYFAPSTYKPEQHTIGQETINQTDYKYFQELDWASRVVFHYGYYNNNGYIFIYKELFAGENNIVPALSAADPTHFPTWPINDDPANYWMFEPNVCYEGVEDLTCSRYPEFVSPLLSNFSDVTETEYVVNDRVWLTFNSYTADEWANEYHFVTGSWNNIGFPFAYVNGIHENTNNRTMQFVPEYCEPGTYRQILSYFGDEQATIEDNLGNEWSADPSVFSMNCGNIWTGWYIVKSTNRHEYPDDGWQDGYEYTIIKQLTKFLVYTVSPEDELYRVQLLPNRYTFSHDYTEIVNRHYEGRICGTRTSTGEDTIPDGYWRIYLGLYHGEDVPILHIEEQEIPPSQILGVPEYNKQINTSETLKYGTVASASITVNLNEPIASAIQHNGELYVLYYDYTHNGIWDCLGFFRVDKVDAIDEYTSRITAHDEVYKLNMYVDDYLENLSGEMTLNDFFTDLLDYCGCSYDSETTDILNGDFELNNIYHAIKTTGVEVAHYVAALSPGFIHANIDGDIELTQYKSSLVELNPSNMVNLTYNAYNADLLDKIKIVYNNTILGEDSGTGENVYYINNNPLISALVPRTTLNNLADDILNTYEEIPTYRPAEIQMLYLLPFTIGDVLSVVTPSGEEYNIAVMAITINGSGVKLTSIGTQAYPVESENLPQFVNLVNDIDQISGEVEDVEQVTTLLSQQIGQNTDDIDALETRMGTAEGNISTLSTQLQNKINNDSISTSSNLTSITINGTTVNNITEKLYVDGLFNSTIKIKTGTLVYQYDSSTMWDTSCPNTMYIGDPSITRGIFMVPSLTPGFFYKNGNDFYWLSGTNSIGWDGRSTFRSFTED